DPSVPLREDEADELVAGVAGWLASLSGEAAGADVVELRLEAPEFQDGDWLLHLGVRTPDGVARSAAEVWAAAGVDAEAAAAQEALLAGLGRCARVFEPLDAALREATPEHVVLDLEQAWTFISEAAPVLSEAGVIVVLPDELSAGDLRLRLRVGVDDAASGAAAEAAEAASDDGAAPPTPAQPALEPADRPWRADDLVGVRRGGTGDGGVMGGLLAGFRWEAALGDATLSPDEFAALVASKAPLVRWRDRWVRVEQDRRQRFDLLGSGGQLPLAEALAIALAGADAPLGDDEDAAPVEVVADGGVAVLLERLREAADRPPAPITPKGFRGRLRGYQRRGVAWLAGMASLGLGAVLADDMGLGKTVQLIAFLLTRDSDGPHLVVCPTSVVGNWEREVARFAPGLRVVRHHGPARPASLDHVRGIVLTTYGTLRRDVDLLARVDWDVVTLDEAQHVKNPTTAGARAVRRLRRRHLLALTGTPLENRLGELWSLLEVTNPGLLGSRARFAKRFATPIEKHRDRAAAARLRRIVAPFVLRREKSDPAVSSDLPDKIERTVVCSLTPEQASLYQAAVERALADGDGLAGASPMQRRGRILALLTELKQICNHPAQYLGQDPDSGLSGRSGKLAVAREIVREAADAGDGVLVFTQYVAMGRLLVAQFSADLGTEVPFLHGGVTAAGRDKLVERFQDGEAPVLVVSLRAGGTGLNLTAATHVLHYDRWWNPAVEDQATDRAHRIGQTRTVEVHKLVTAGTLEERIAEVLEGKRALADSVVGAGEAWITELGDDELRDLVALSEDATVEDLDEDLDDWAEAGLR
ncbi:MAG TPA: DEAD/DEAH box helicase, partial [Egibacteraceae bacterium]